MTHEVDWYAEELFARFALVEAEGTYNGLPVRLPTAAQVKDTGEQAKVSGT
jgi:hypothetical protein